MAKRGVRLCLAGVFDYLCDEPFCFCKDYWFVDEDVLALELEYNVRVCETLKNAINVLVISHVTVHGARLTQVTRNMAGSEKRQR